MRRSRRWGEEWGSWGNSGSRLGYGRKESDRGSRRQGARIRCECAQKSIDGEFGPAHARRIGVAMRHGETLAFEIQSDNHAQQQFRGAVRIVMPELSTAHGP